MVKDPLIMASGAGASLPGLGSISDIVDLAADPLEESDLALIQAEEA